MAQEKPTERDKSLGSNVATENIDVRSSGRYYPVEYASAIQYYDRTNQLKAAIPQALAGIVDNYNVYQTNKYTLEKDADLAIDAKQFEYDSRFEEFKLQQDQNNLVYDRYKQMQSRYDELMEKARLEGSTNRAESISQELEGNFKEWDEASPYMKAQWRSMYNHHVPSMIHDAKMKDYAYSEWTTQNNIVNFTDTQLNEVTNGTKSREEVYNAVAQYYGEISDSASPKTLQDNYYTMYNNSLILEADVIKQKVFTEDLTVEQGLEALIILLEEEPVSKRLEKNGKPVLDSEGNEVYLTGSKDPSTQQKLIQAWHQINNFKAGANGESAILESSLSDEVKDFIYRSGYALMPDGKINYNRNRFGSADVFGMEANALIDKILNSKIRTSAKASLLRELIPKALAVQIDYNINEIMATSKGRAGESLKEGINKAYSLLKRGELDLLLKEGITYVDENGNKKSIQLPIYMRTLVRMGNPDVSAELYLNECLDRLNTYKDKILSEETSYILDSTDPAFGTQLDNANNALDKGLITDKDAAAFQTAILQRDKIANSKGYSDVTISNQEFDTYFSTIRKNSKTTADLIHNSSTFGRQLVLTGHGEDLLLYRNNLGNNKEYDDVIKYAYLGMMTSPDSSAIKVLSDFYTAYPTAEDRDAVEKRFNIQLQMNGINSENLKRIEKAPSTHSGMLLNLANDIQIACISQGDAKKANGIISKIIDDNFITLDKKSNCDQSLYVNSRTFNNLSKKLGLDTYRSDSALYKQKLTNAVSDLLGTYNSNMQDVYNALGIKASDHVIQEDAKNCSFVLCKKDGKRIAIPYKEQIINGDKITIGTLDLSILTSTNIKQVAEMNAYMTGLGIALTNNNAFDYAYYNKRKKYAINVTNKVQNTLKNAFTETIYNNNYTKNKIGKDIKQDNSTTIHSGQDYYESPTEMRTKLMAEYKALRNTNIQQTNIVQMRTGGAIYNCGSNRGARKVIMGH